MKFAFVFPGQGSQSLGMMAGFDGLAVVRDTFTEASDILKQDLWALVTAGRCRSPKRDIADAAAGIRDVMTGKVAPTSPHQEDRVRLRPESFSCPHAARCR